MPCLTDVIDCLLCGERTSCSQVAGSNPDDPKKNWSVHMCKLFGIEDEELREEFRQSYYCSQCTCRITSMEKISELVVNMTKKLEEIRGVLEDSIYLSNTHLFAAADGEEEVKTQNTLRERVGKVLEAIKKKKETPVYADAEVLTDPVIIVESEPSEPETHVIVLPDTAVKEDKECQCTILQDPFNTVGHQGAGRNGKTGEQQMIKMLFRNEVISQDMIKALSAPKGESDTRQLIIRGYRQVDCAAEDAPSAVISPQTNEPKKRGRRAGTKNPPRIPPEVCKICRDRFQDAEATRKHLDDEHKLQNGLFQCPKCSITVTTERSLIRHVNKHYNQPDQNQDESTTVGEDDGAKEIGAETEIQQVPQPRKSQRSRRPSKRKQSTSEEEESEEEEEEEEDEEEAVIEEESDGDSEEQEEESSDEYVEEESNRRSSRKKTTVTPKASRKRGRQPAKKAMVIKVPSNKRVSSSVVEQALDADEPTGPSPLGTRLRSKFRTYFH